MTEYRKPNEYASQIRAVLLDGGPQSSGSSWLAAGPPTANQKSHVSFFL